MWVMGEAMTEHPSLINLAEIPLIIITNVIIIMIIQK